MEQLNWVISGTLPGDMGFFPVTMIGTFDGVNSVFSLQPVATGGIMVFWSGALLTPGVQPDGQYIFAGSQIIFQPQAIPGPDNVIEIFGWSQSNSVGFQAANLIGTIGGGNAIFMLQPAPTNGAMIFWNGELLTQGTQDTNPPGQYILSGGTVIFDAWSIPPQGTVLTAFVW